MPEKQDDKCASECGFMGDCPEGTNCPLPNEPLKVPEEEIVALYRTYHGHDGAVLSLAVSNGKPGCRAPLILRCASGTWRKGCYCIRS